MMDPFTTVWRVSRHGGRVRTYHSQPDCIHMRKQSPLKSRLGSMTAAQWNPCQKCYRGVAL